MIKMEGETSSYWKPFISMRLYMNRRNFVNTTATLVKLSIPRQRNHDCLKMNDEVKWLFYTPEAVKQVKHKRCIWRDISGLLNQKTTYLGRISTSPWQVVQKASSEFEQCYEREKTTKERPGISIYSFPLPAMQ